MVQIKWTNLAVFDLEEIYEYIARDSKKYAQLQAIKIKAARIFSRRIHLPAK